MTEVRMYCNPEVKLRLAVIPGVLYAVYDEPPADAEVPHVRLDSRMGAEFRMTRCRHDDHFQFTLEGWKAFLDAVKAGEFDHLLPSSP